MRSVAQPGLTMRKRIFAVWNRTWGTLLLCLLGLIFLIPVLWMLSLSLQTFPETLRSPLTWLPHFPQWSNYLTAFKIAPLLTYMANTLVITIATTIGMTASAAVSAYALARLNFPGRNIIFAIILSTLMLPSAVTLIPLYSIFRNLNWINTFYPLIIPAFFGGGASIAGGAYNIFLMRQFMRTIPRELDEAAFMDGANHWQIFWHIILPLSKPALAIVGLTSAIVAWNDYLGPLIYLNTPDKFTLALGLVNYAGSAGLFVLPQPQLLMAATAMMVLPILLIFIFAQRYLIQGIVMTGLKG